MTAASSCPPHGSVVAVVVSFHPDPAQLTALLTVLEPQVTRVVIVDNGSQGEVSDSLTQGLRKTELVLLGENLGIATAQNRGIDRARALGADAVLLLDQDSVPSPDMVLRLMDALVQLQGENIAVAALGPRYIDRIGQVSEPFVLRRGLLIGRCRCRQANEILPVDFLISSGSLIPLATLDRVGSMEECLFMDYVDTEWIIRAATLGYRAFGVCSAGMTHSLGDSVKTLFGFSVTLRSPLRHYYLFRNAVWFYRQAWVPLSWRLADAIKLFQRFIAYLSLAKPRTEHFAMMIRGLADGWHGRMGRFQER